MAETTIKLEHLENNSKAFHDTKSPYDFAVIEPSVNKEDKTEFIDDHEEI